MVNFEKPFEFAPTSAGVVEFRLLVFQPTGFRQYWRNNWGKFILEFQSKFTYNQKICGTDTAHVLGATEVTSAREPIKNASGGGRRGQKRDAPLGLMYLVLTTEPFPDEKLTDKFVQICSNSGSKQYTFGLIISTGTSANELRFQPLLKQTRPGSSFTSMSFSSERDTFLASNKSSSCNKKHWFLILSLKAFVFNTYSSFPW